MAKKVSNTASGDLELDFDLDSFEFDFEQPKVDEKRTPITRFAKGLVRGAKSTLTDPKVIKDSIKRALPRAYGETMDYAEDGMRSLQKLYDDSSRELKPAIKSMRRAALALAPKEEGKLPARVEKLLGKWRQQEAEDRRKSIEPSREQNMELTIKQIFAAESEERAQARFRDVADRNMQMAVSDQRFKNMFTAVNSIAVNASRLTSYQTKMTHRYQQKSLELQYRQLFATQDLIKVTAEASKARDQYLAAIAKNTSLPDAVKVSASELRGQVFKTKMYEAMADGIFGGRNNYIRKTFDGLGKKLIEEVKSIASMAIEGSEGAVMMKQNMDMAESFGEKFDMADRSGELVGAMGAQYGLSRLASRFKRRVVGSKFDKKYGISKMATKLTRFAENAPNALNEFRKRDDYLFGDSASDALMSWIQTLLPGVGPDLRLARMTAADMNKPFYLTRRSDKSINEVIPGYLARIWRELQVIRTGNENIGLSGYDFQRGRFTTVRKIEKSLQGQYVSKGQQNSFTDTSREILSKIDPTNSLSEGQRKRLLERLLRNSTEMNLASRDRLVGEEMYGGGKDGKAASDAMSRFLSNLSDEQRLEFERLHNRMGGTLGDPREFLQEQMDLGNHAMLYRSGLVNRDDTLNVDKYREMFVSGAIRDLGLPSSEFVGPLPETARAKMVRKAAAAAREKRDKLSAAAAEKMSELDQMREAISSRAKRGVASAASAALNPKQTAESIAEAVSKTAQSLKDVAKDVFVPGEISPRLKAVLMKQGEYVSVKTGKIIYNLKQIDGPIINRAKEVIVDASEVAKLVVQDDKGNMPVSITEISQQAKQAAADPLAYARQKAADLGASRVGKLFSTMAENAKDEWGKFGKDEIKEAADVWVQGEVEPRLTAVKMKAGEYRDRLTGEPVLTPSDIKGPVVDSNNQTRLEVEDLGKLRHFSAILGAFAPLKLSAGIFKSIGKGMWWLQTSLGPRWAAWNLKQLWKLTKFTTRVGMKMLGLGSRAVGLPVQDLISKRTGKRTIIGRLLEAGEYFCETTKERLKSLADIRGPVVDSNNQTVVSKEDIDAGLTTVDGTPVKISPLTDRLKSVFDGLRNTFRTTTVETNGKPSGLKDKFEQKLKKMTPERLMGAIKGTYANMANRFGLSREEVGQLEIRKILSDIREGLVPKKEREGSWSSRMKNKIFSGKKSEIGTQESKKDSGGGVMKLISGLLSTITGFLGKGPVGMLAGAAGGLTSLGVSATAGIVRGGMALIPAMGTLASLGAAALSPPVLGALVIGGAAYGGYKLYKHLTRGNISTIEKMRMVQYGLMPEDTSRFKNMIDLENAVFPAISKSDSIPTLDYGKLRLESLMSPFGLNYQRKEHIDAFMNWFKRRFEPVLMTHVAALNRVDSSMGLHDVSDLKGESKGKYFEMAKFPDGPYSVNALPYLAEEKVRVSGASEVQKAIQAVYDEAKDAPKNKMSLVPVAGASAQTVAAPTKDPRAAKFREVYNRNETAAVMFEGSSPVAAVALSDGTRIAAIDAVRFKTYGLIELSVDKVKTLRQLEDKVKEFVTFDQAGTAKWKGNVVDILTKAGTPFGTSDYLSASGRKWTSWFSNRFLPVYLLFQTNYRKSTGRVFDGQNSLAMKSSTQLETATQMRGLSSVWAFNTSPWFDVGVGTDSYAVVENINHLLQVAESAKLMEEKSNKAPRTTNTPQSLPQTLRSSQPKISPTTKSPTAQASPDAELRPEGTGGTVAPPKYSLGAIKALSGELLDGRNASSFMQVKRGVNVDNLNEAFKSQLFGAIEEYGRITGDTVIINDGYRSFAEQAALKKKLGNQAASPGSSLHEFGLAVDIDRRFLDRMDKLGILRKYGLTRPVGMEPWHLEPIGIQSDLTGARSDALKASSAVRAGIGKGGGGYGTLSDAKQYGRSPDLSALIYGAKIATSSVTKTGEDDPKVANKAPVSLGRKMVTKAGSPDSKFVTPKEYVETTRALATTKQGTPDSEVKPSSGSSAPVADGYENMRDTIVAAARQAGFDPEILLGTVAMESDFRTGATPGSSSAKGPLQWTDRSWKETVSKHGAKYGLDPRTASPMDLKAASLMAAHYYQDNLPALESKLGRKAGVAEAYLTHLLGRSGAVRFVSALNDQPDAKAADILPDAAASNPGIFYSQNQPLTVAQVYGLIANRVSEKMARYGIKSVATAAATTIQKTNPQVLRKEPAQTPPATVAQAARPVMRVASYEDPSELAQNKGLRIDRNGGMSGQKSTSSTNEILTRSLDTQVKLLQEFQSFSAKVLERMGSSSSSNQATPSAPSKAEVQAATPYVPPRATVRFERPT